MASKAERNRFTRDRLPKFEPRARLDGELYQRPEPDLRSEQWQEGFLDGYDGAVAKRMTDYNYRDGYTTGQAEAEYDREEMNRSGSSNA